MRAPLTWLAVVPLIFLVGCRTVYDRGASDRTRGAVQAEGTDLAEALAHYSQALIFESTLGGFDASLRHSRLAAEHDPSFLPMTLKVAAGYLTRKENDRALLVLNRAKIYHPESVEVRLLLGIVHQLSDHAVLAAREFNSAIRLAPARADGYVRLATLYAAEARLKKVLSTLDAALAKCRDHAVLSEFCDNMGRLYLQGGRPAEALQFFDRIRADQPDNPAIKELTARCRAALGDYRHAVTLLRELEASQPGNIKIVILLGEVYELQGDWVRAEECLIRGVQALPQDVMTWLQLANLQLRLSPDRALKTLREALTHNPGDISLRAFLARLYSRQQQFDAAIAEFEAIGRAAEKDPALARTLQPQFFFWYGTACEQGGRFQDAERLLERCIDLNPDFAQALNYLAYMWAAKNMNLDKAQEYVMRALKIHPEDGAFLDTLGWVYYQKGAFKESLTYLNKALDRMPDDPVIAEHLGDVWAALKNSRKAGRFWRLSLKQAPDNAAVRNKLNRTAGE
jgi:tetratricopeptide (TPR) repeat protein